MEMISVHRAEYEKLRAQVAMLKELEKLDFDLLRQFRGSLEDVRAGRIRRVA